MTTISAKTILRSRNATKPDKVLSTLLLRYPRFIHAELMTHRAFSRNAASSRAIPVAKIIEDILADTAMPIHWGKDQKGMQAAEQCFSSINLWKPSGGFTENMPVKRERAWLLARDAAVTVARSFTEAGYHKQVVNRLLEPFMHITVLVSATEWGNFLELRDHQDAEPHIQILAREIRACLEDVSTIQTLEPGQWHLPFTSSDGVEDGVEINADAGIKLSVARCASTSYKTVDGFNMTLERAVQIFDKLVTSRPLHASPLEHVAVVDTWQERVLRNGKPQGWWNTGQHGNFVGFRQYRHMLEQSQ